jgi:drug/metabolite transporter (DMT)-like permease
MAVPSASAVPEPSGPSHATTTPLPTQILEVQAGTVVSIAPPASLRTSSDSALAGLGWMLVANVLFAAMTIFARIASSSASWAEVGAARAGVGAAVAFAFAMQRGASLTTRRRGLSWARSLFGTAAMLSTFYALGARDLLVGDAVTLGATSPIFLALLSGPLLGERPGRIIWAVTVVAFAGIALIAGPRFSSGGSSAAVALAAAGFSAFAMVFLRRMRSGDGGDAETVEAITLHFSLVAFVVHVAVAAPGLTVPTSAGIGWLTATGLAGGLAQMAMTRAYALTEAARLGAASYVGTVLSQLGAVLFLGEVPGTTQLAGGALVVGAGVALAWGTARGARRGARTR